MLHFDRTDISEGIDVNKASASRECDICHCWHFLNKGFMFQPNACNRCHDLLMMSMNRSDIAILNIKSADYHCIISGISKNEAINLMQIVDLAKKAKKQQQQNIIKHKHLLSRIKMGKEIFTFCDIEIEKKFFYRNKIPIFLKDVDTEKVLVSNKIFFGKNKL